MGASSIEWTDVVWNPTTGCDRVSPGCRSCYALTMAARLKAMGQAKYQNDGDPRTSGPGFGLTIHPDELDRPLYWRKPRRVFVNSMSDLFHPDVPQNFIGQVFGVMALARAHTFQVLTKRPQRMAEMVRSVGFRLDVAQGVQDQGGFPVGFSVPTGNVWLGTSIESDRYAFRADHLRETPAAVRFLSLEPLLGPLPSLDLTGIDWVIVGGESGPGARARPMHPDWVRDIRDRCVAADIPFFFKQWGAWRGFGRDQFGASYECAAANGALHHEWNAGPEGEGVFTGAAVRLGKKAAGRELDGRTWDEMPG